MYEKMSNKGLLNRRSEEVINAEDEWGHLGHQAAVPVTKEMILPNTILSTNLSIK